MSAASSRPKLEIPSDQTPHDKDEDDVKNSLVKEARDRSIGARKTGNKLQKNIEGPLLDDKNDSGAGKDKVMFRRLRCLVDEVADGPLRWRRSRNDRDRPAFDWQAGRHLEEFLSRVILVNR